MTVAATFLHCVTILSLVIILPNLLAAKKASEDASEARNSTGSQPENCILSVALVAGLDAAKLDGLCYDDKLMDRVCCKNIAVAGSTQGTGKGGVVSVYKIGCKPHEYCCVVKANAAGLGQNTVNC